MYQLCVLLQYLRVICLLKYCVGILSNKLYSCEGIGWSQSAIGSIALRVTVLRLDIQFHIWHWVLNCLQMIICLKLFFKIKHGNLFQNLTYCAASIRARVVTNLVHVFQMEILFALWWEQSECRIGTARWRPAQPPSETAIFLQWEGRGGMT